MNDVMVMSYIHPAFFYNGEYFLLVLSSIFLIELCSLAVGRAVWIRLIQQTLIVDTLSTYDKASYSLAVHIYLNGCKYGGDVIRRTPAIL